MKIINNSSLSMEEIQQIRSASGHIVRTPPPDLDWSLYEHFIIDWSDDTIGASEQGEVANEQT